MTSRLAHLRSILALPFMVLVVIPTGLLLAGQRWLDLAATPVGPGQAGLWLALPCFAAGTTLMVLTISMFATVGQGTLAPWQPTRKLVVVGVYRHVRNPMISGVLANLLGEAALFWSPALAGWFASFAIGNAIYIPLLEEPGLVRRFGDDYQRYRASVPRWIPRLRGYSG